MAKIMIAEDNGPNVQLLQDLLASCNHEVAAIASDGAEAVDVYNKVKPDVLLLDVAMPKKNGKEALKEIMTANPDAKVIMVTAMEDMETIQECIEKGAIAYIIKPYEIDDIQKAVSMALDM
jgi:two-component system chemotaxis response regulator CheY